MKSMFPARMGTADRSMMINVQILARWYGQGMAGAGRFAKGRGPETIEKEQALKQGIPGADLW